MLMAGLLMLVSDLLLLEDIYSDYNVSSITLIMIMLALIFQILISVLQAVLVHRLCKSRDEHFRRDMNMQAGITELMGVWSNKKMLDLNVERWTMNTILIDANAIAKERSPGLWAVLVAIPFLGMIFTMIILHILSKDLYLHEERQLAFNNQLQFGMLKYGRTPANNLLWAPQPRRSSAAYAVLSILSLGLFIPYWFYTVMIDTKTHFRSQWKYENELVDNLQREG